MTIKLKEIPIVHFSVAEYLEEEARQGERLEYFDGKIIPTPEGTVAHNRICRNLLTAFDNLFMASEQFEVLGSDQKVFLSHYNFYLYPDAVIIAKDIEVVEGQVQAITNPVLIVEVASRSTQNYDKGEKFTYYKSIPSFQEYVLVHQDRPEVNLFFREEPDLWRSTDVIGLGQAVTFRSVAESLQMTQIYRQISF